ncbi:MAG: hypothetical protein LBR53_05420 [Deltaproteobacteria bacterium]|jgi:hypothetical protein|nr:hypothetical protein [Deltaproteobacteria bacterium]
MRQRRLFPLLFVSLCFFLSGCGDQNPLLGSWHLDTTDQSVYVRLGLSLATAGQNVTVVFGEEDMIVNFGRGEETVKVTYNRNPDTKMWNFCLDGGNNCFPAVFTDDKKNRVSFPLYGISMNFIRQPE